MNIENLKALRTFEQEQIAKGATLNMADYTHYCGTAFCHAGFELLRIGQLQEFLPTVNSDRDNMWITAADSLDLCGYESDFLFAGITHQDYGNVCSPSEGRARLDYLIEHEKAPPDMEDWAEGLTL